jgi:hypothetical protein
MNTIFLLVAPVVLLFLVFGPAWLLNVLTDRKWPGLVWLLPIFAMGAMAITKIVVEVKSAPIPSPIHDKVNADISSSPLSIQSVQIDYPEEGKAQIGIDIVNDSSKEVSLEVDYYADGGTIGGIYSPGAAGASYIQDVTPEWSGTMLYRVWVPKFVSGGEMSVTVIDRDARLELLSKTYAVVPPEDGSL